ncbi:hypothetical protein CVT26_001995 [Gymnopilus dilepis]|uniref:Uncharacterized protein n=1 Tax=Gymnopilus dilepis TaxID=231916 RepID=A0A409VEX7_9AGAR|nr:hypothetical protein CVT26_001995 [Gymnopilus dilepis]
MPAQSKPVQQLTPFGAALAGALGGCFSTAVVYPLDVAKTRIQALPSDAKGKGKDQLSMTSVLLRIYKQEGILGLYRGFGATMLNTFSMQYAYFFFYSLVRSTYIKRLSKKLAPGSKLPPLSTAAELLLGAVAGALAQIFTIPVSVIATRQQVGRPEKLKGPDQPEKEIDDSFMAVAREIIEEEGVGGLWLGIKPGLVLTVNPAITYGVFERVKSLVLLAKGESSTKMGPWLSFVVGALSKTLATIVTYPYIMAKVRIQARSADAEDATEHHEELPHAHEYHHKHIPQLLEDLRMSATPATPRTKTTFAPTTPATARVAGNNPVQASPHYATTRRHSLYGSEDRVVIDAGSRIWKVGFSGEGRPRDVFYANGPNGPPFWKLTRAMDPAERAEEDRMLEARLQKCLRSVFHDSLLADPKARKVILVEHPLLPLYIKEMIAKILFENQASAMLFACIFYSPPIFAARPMFPQIQTTPIAGSRLTSHIRALMLMFATYIPPPASLSAASSVPAANRATRVPQEVLTDAVIEEIKTRCCFVGNVLGPSSEERREETPEAEDGSEMDIPPSDTGSESSVASRSMGTPRSGTPTQDTGTITPTIEKPLGEVHLQALANLYKRHSTATDIHMHVVPPPSQPTGTGRGTLIIPGWVRERGAEVLFEGGDVDESSLAETILDALLKVPRDLRKTLVSSILVSGGTAMLPGFIPRLQAEIVLALNPPTTSSRHLGRRGMAVPPPYDKYGSLRPLLPHIAILNNPSPPPPASERAGANAGKAPAFSPATLAWVGGSLAGSLKTGGVEVARDKWDDDSNRNADESMDISGDVKTPPRSILPDWTRSPLPVGAPPANVHSQASV